MNRHGSRPLARRVATLALGLVALAAAAGEKRPLVELPYTPGLDVTAMNPAADACQDFFTYSCGGWIERNPIPADRPEWSVYSKLADDNLQYLWGLLEALSAPREDRTPNELKIGDYFAACMDTDRIASLGARPLEPMLRRIEAIDSPGALVEVLADLHSLGGNGDSLFGFTAWQDLEDSSSVIGVLISGGLGLPDRDYYTDTTPRMQETRERYVAHIERMLVLLGDSPERAAAQAASIMALETKLAEATLTRVESRDARNLNHPMSPTELGALAPSFGWPAYFAARHGAPMQRLNVTEPAFFRALESALSTTPLAELKGYLRWTYLNGNAGRLSPAFVDANFDFYRAYLYGVEQQPPRWKTCVQRVDDQLGEALGEVFVARNFPPETREQAVAMVKTIEQAMAERIQGLDWMSEVTKSQALAKLASVRNKIGHPDRWRDYSTLAVERDDFFGNVVRGAAFAEARELAKIGKPVDPDEWYMTPQTVNAYYDPQLNSMNFPAGVLQPPLFDARIDAAPSWGNTGSTIGHELTHGFDDSGRRFDKDGNLTDWWSAEDSSRFDAQSQCLVEQYGGYTVVDDIKINSKLTLGEDIADLGGTILAYMGWQAATAGMELESRDGLTPEQRFFVGFAQWACGHETDERARAGAVTDPHSPLRHRINGVVVNMPEFARAFNCKQGDAMVKPEGAICKVW